MLNHPFTLLQLRQHALETFDDKRPYAGTEVIKEIVEQRLNLEYPSRIHAQKMRTYLATACQVGAWENDVIYSHCVYHISESILSGHTELPS